MNRAPAFFTFIAALLLSCITLNAGISQPQLINLDPSIGFPQIGTNFICQDKDGNIWITSENGQIVCYNGYDIIFSAKFRNVSSPYFYSETNTLYFISESRLYFVSGPQSTPSALDIDSGINCIGGSPDGKKLILTSRTRLCVYDPHRGSQEWMKLPRGAATIKAISGEGELLLCDRLGQVFTFDLARKSSRKLFDFKSSISSCRTGPDSTIWVTTLGHGLFRIDPGSGGSRNYSIADGLSSDFVHDVCFDLYGRLWIGTKQGLDVLDTRDNSVIICKRNQYNTFSLSHDTVRRIFRDSQDGMWIGTYFGGLDYWHSSIDGFKSILPGEGDEFLNDFVISSLSESEDGLIWIGTNKGGLNCFDPVKGKLSHYLIPSAEGDVSREFNDIKYIWCHPDGRRIFLGTHGRGLTVFDRKTKRFSRLKSPRFVYSITPDADGKRLILGTISSTGCLWLYDLVSGDCKRIPGDAFSLICRDSRGLFWTGPVLRPYTMDDNGNLTESAGMVPDDFDVTCAVEDNEGNMWFGGENGLMLLRPGGEGEIILGRDIIPDVNSLEIDASGAIWIGTENGLYRYGASDKRLRKYDTTEGLASSFFCDNAVLKARNGSIWFGGIGGVSVVYPDRIIPGNECPDPVVSEMYVNEKRYPAGTGELILKHDENRISFRLSAPDYCALRGNIFQCCLEGYEKNWFAVGDERLVIYKNLPKGHYRLRIRVSRNGVDWSETSDAVRFRIKPIWYKSTVAVLLWIILSILLIFALIISIIRHNTMKNKILLFEMEKKHASEMRKLKALKFINASPSSRKESKPKPVFDLSEKDELFLSRAIDIVERNISNSDFKTEDLASALKISRKTLHTRLKELTNGTALDFIHKIRFSEACRLLTETDDTISEICYKVGGKSPSNFAASFKSYVGCTPQQYAKKERT